MRTFTLSSGRPRRRTAAGAAIGLIAALAVVVTASGHTPAQAATPGPGGIAQPDPQSVTADALPTVQIDGVVWSQVVVGNTVYAGGNFANARPAGSAAGVNNVPRTDLLAYDITTGNLIDSFAPVLNGQVQSLAVSPDGSRLYAVGNFTTVNGAVHNRIAAFNTSTGSLLSSFNGGVDAGVHSIAVTNSTVYVGGLFQNANGVPRQHLAAFDTTGALTAWAPTADDSVEAMTLSPDGSRLIIGGHFVNVNGVSAPGMASVDATTGASLPWAINGLVRDSGSGSAITSLSTDGTNIIGTGYSYSGGGNYEGTFSADPSTGNVVWMEDCHGDTYGAFVAHGTVYTVSHAHYCGNDNGWPVYPTWQYRRSVAFTDSVTGVLAPNAQSGYTDFSGQPSPSIVNWFPDYQIGTFTGQGQAAWSVAGNSNYVVEGGEFPSVNGVAQQGLVRFAVRGIAPATSGPMVTGAHFVPSVNSYATGTAHISFQTNWDRDSKTLSYALVRNSDTAHPVWSGTLDSEWWNLPQVSVTDTGLTPGATYKYRLYATDPDGNKVAGDTVSYTVPLTASTTAYDQQVVADGATSYWPLDEASGYVAYDNANGNDADLTGTARGVAGPVSPETGTTFAGSSSSYLATRTPLTGPNVFTLSAWVKTTTTRGGKIIGFGNQQTGASALYDRQLYLDNNGRVNFGVLSPSGARNVVTSARTVNDGQWHQIVGQLSPTGMTIYVDGVRVGRRTDTTAGKGYFGFWRVGGDALSSWTNSPSSGYLSGSLADIAIFPTALTSAQIQQEYVASGRSLPTAPVPSDAYGQAVRGNDPDVFWRLDDTSGSQAADTSVTNSPGTYFGGYSLNQASPVTTIGRAVYFNGSNATIGSSSSVTPPTVYSEEAWFKTSTRNGGKILGFGNKQSGTSGSVDRNVYMLASGQLAFGVNAGSRVVVTSPNSYNDNQWHQVVATQGPDGMTLYVDGLPVTSGPTTTATTSAGYWRVGGDTSWSGANYFAGYIDEVAFYSTELGASQVLAHYKASPAHVDRPPTASFTSSVNYLAANFDGTASSDPDGTVAAYAWNFGDGSTGSGATATHTYATAGTYSVTLTVTDDEGATGTSTQSVTVTNPPPNQLPVAAFTPTCTNLGCSFDGTASSDPDGTVVGYAWDFGDGTTGSGATATHTYATPGTYSVTLTVTDNRGGQSTLSTPVTVTPPNQPPVAVITTSAVKLAVNFDGTGSSDPDGTVAAYAWNFGDGATASTATARHVYAAAGQYLVTLTVTDNEGASTTATKTITVVAPGTWIGAADSFGRTVTNGLGTADQGGAYTLVGSKALFSVANGTGNLTMSAVGTGPSAYLSANPAQDVQGVVDVSFDSAPTGGGTMAYLATRRVGTSDYVLKAKFAPTSTTLYLSKIFNGTETVLASKVISGLVYNAGDVVRMRFESVGVNPTTLLGRIWKVGTAEPTTWQLQATDSEPTLQTAGGYGIQTYLTGTATTAPVTASFDNLQFTGVTVAAFTPTVSYLAASFDASQSASVGGTITSYAWDFGDGTTGTGVTPTHTYAAAGTYTVLLTVTDSLGGTDSMSVDITVAPNQPPVAAFSSSVANLTASFDGTASTDPDGTVVGYAWDFGDGTTATGATAQHTYAAAGTYTVTLTVTDDQGATGTITHAVTATAPNQPPVAAFSASMTNLTASVDGSASSDPDGTVVGYAWDFGDGTTATGATAQHTYAAPGTYTVTLTVTDNQGATTSLAQSVTATPVPPLAADTFARTVTNGWGSADSGGAWTLSGAASLFSVSGGTGRVKLASAGAGPGAFLNGVSIGDSNTTVDMSFDSMPTGGGTYGYMVARHAGTSDYRFKVKVTATAATLYLTKVVSGTETVLASKTIALTYNLGDTLRLRFLVSGSSPTTLSGKVWKVGTTEPAAYQVTATDSEPTLQTPGAVGLMTYLSGSSTTVPVTTSFANYTVATP